MKKDSELLKNLPLPVKLHIKHLERVRSDFIANVSHELRTPLTVIHGYLEGLLKENEIDKKFLKKIYQQMYQHSIRMENIIDDLLLLSRLENEEISDVKKQINITKMLKHLYDDAKIISGNKQQEITLKMDKKIFIHGFEEELKSLFYNLITNAIKYTPSQGKIEIEWYACKKKAIFKIKDNGIGIAKKNIPRITERFYRVDKSRSRENGGTGLGLAIAKHVLVNHH
ncbi:MAG TPA: ATP-binding protein, partial [Gammaproteobacteria bacterium]|nr:ATP-binding protein [Gammaproteobacteria bacterium]